MPKAEPVVRCRRPAADPAWSDPRARRRRPSGDRRRRRALPRGRGGHRLVGRARDGEEALELIAAPLAGRRGARRPHAGLRRDRDPARSATSAAPAVILYTGFPERSLLLEALDAGARGFLAQGGPAADLLRAIQLRRGRPHLRRPGARRRASPAPQAAERLPSLRSASARSCGMLADGMRNDGVASALSISPLTVQYAREERDGEARGRHAHAARRERAARVADHLTRPGPTSKAACAAFEPADPRRASGPPRGACQSAGTRERKRAREPTSASRIPGGGASRHTRIRCHASEIGAPRPFRLILVFDERADGARFEPGAAPARESRC